MVARERRSDLVGALNAFTGSRTKDDANGIGLRWHDGDRTTQIGI